jgi:hypothetical protein
MQTPDDIRRDLPSDLEPAEAEPLTALALRLQAERPGPAPAFRNALRRRLLGATASGRDEGSWRAGWQRPRMTRGAVRALAAAYAAAGTLLLAIATLGLAGAGPLAPA